MRFTAHDFRRVFATDAIRTGLPPHIAAKILGHSDVNTTMRYADDVIGGSSLVGEPCVRCRMPKLTPIGVAGVPSVLSR